jgi:cytochrome c
VAFFPDHRRIARIVLAAGALFFAGSEIGRAADGKAIFNRSCSVCHSLDEGKNRFGPSLFGVVGRKAGSVDHFSYSTANKSSGITWTREALDQYLTDPQKMVPGTLMVFPGIKNPDDRGALIDFLAATN